MSGILGALLINPLKGFKGAWTGWKAAGSATRTLADGTIESTGHGLGAALKDVGDTLTNIPGNMKGKAAAYMADTFKNGTLRGVGKMAFDSIGGVALAGSTVIGKTIQYGIGMPLTALGFGARLGTRAAHKLGQIGGYDALKGGASMLGNAAWWATKTGSKGLALEGLKAGKLGYATARGIWAMRNNRSAQTLAFAGIAGTAMTYGAMKGERNVIAGQMLPYDEFQSTFTSAQPIHNPTYANVPGERGRAHAIDDFGADGSLVFAMNNLRKTGVF